jgi:tetratricopeptide (TPR) repeat protein
MGLLVVVTYRESEMQVSRHPFLKLKLDLTARGICQEIRLDYLGRREVERYLALRFPGSSFPSDFCARLHARTEGHPLFVADLAGYLRDHRAIVEENGGWAVTPLFAETEKQLPESVRSMIELKITQVPEEDIRILMAASVQGLEFDSAVVAEAAAVDPETLEESMERLERVHSLVRVVEERDMPDRTLSCRYRFVHALYQNSLYAKLRPTRRASLCGLMAQSLTRFWGERKGEIASDLARLFEGARDYARAAEFYLAAARNSAALFAHREAALLARRGLEMVKALPASPESGRLELPLQLVLGGSIALTGGYVVPEVKACFTRATDLTAAAGSSVALFPALWGQSFYYHVTADCAESRKLGDQMLRLAESGHDQLLLPAAHFARALVWELEGNHTAVLQQSGEVMRLAPDPAAGHRGRVARFMVDPVISAYGQHARSLCFLGHYSRCQAQLDRLLTIAASERFDPRSRSDAIISVCVCHQAMGNASEISGLAAKGLDLCDKHELFMERHMTGWMLGWALSMTGSAAEGIHQMRACKGLFGAIGIRMFVETQLSANLAEALLLAGEPDEARTVIDAALAFAHSSGHRYFEPELLRIQGEIAAAAGDAEKARDWFRQSADLAREQRTATFELKTALSLGRLLMAAGKRAEAKAAVAAVYHSLTADSQKVDSSFETADLRTAAEALGS